MRCDRHDVAVSFVRFCLSFMQLREKQKLDLVWNSQAIAGADKWSQPGRERHVAGGMGEETYIIILRFCLPCCADCSKRSHMSRLTP